MRITVSRPVNGIPGKYNEYVLGIDGTPLVFTTVHEAVNYLADRNWTIDDLREADFNMEQDYA
jgi:hypothetical protein